MLKKSKVAENFKRYKKFKSCRKFAEQLVAKPSEERLSSLIILRIHKHANFRVISEALKIKIFWGSTPQTPLEACVFGACFTTPSCAYFSGKTTLRP